MTRFSGGFGWIVAVAIGAMFIPGVGWATPPLNDDFDNATVITSLAFADTLDVREATRAADDPVVCSYWRETVWYKFEPTSTLDIAINQFGSTSLMELMVFTGSRGALNFIEGNCNLGVVEFTAQAGTTYFIMVNPSTSQAAGDLTLHIAEAQYSSASQVIGQPDVSWSGCNSLGRSASSLCSPSKVLVASDTLYVADRSNHRILVYDRPLTTDTIADGVFGQMGDFSTGDCNLGGVSADSICQPNGLAIDASGNLFVGDSNNNRVLEFDSSLTETTADRVFGQPDLNSAVCNNGGLSASSLCVPRGVAVDGTGRLYVADGFTGNRRVLVYESPLTDSVADDVIGQPDFTTAGCNTGGIGAGSVCTPAAMAFDAMGNLYLADQGNNRILIYFNPLLDDDVADMVIGQPDFFTVTFPPPSASTLFQPIDLAIDWAGNLYVADIVNNRVLVYWSPLTTDVVADQVYGQPDFTNGQPNFEGVSGRGLFQPRGVALDANENLYVSDQGNSRVVVYDTDIDADGIPSSQDACLRETPVGVDTDHDGCTDSIAGLKTIVQNLSISSSLKSGLIGKLDEALKALNRGNARVAANKLHDFINQVEGAHNNYLIFDVDAALLIAYANNLITLIGGQA